MNNNIITIDDVLALSYDKNPDNSSTHEVITRIISDYCRSFVKETIEIFNRNNISSGWFGSIYLDDLDETTFTIKQDYSSGYVELKYKWYKREDGIGLEKEIYKAYDEGRLEEYLVNKNRKKRYDDCMEHITDIKYSLISIRDEYYPRQNTEQLYSIFHKINTSLGELSEFITNNYNGGHTREDKEAEV